MWLSILFESAALAFFAAVALGHHQIRGLRAAGRAKTAIHKIKRIPIRTHFHIEVDHPRFLF
ncbi:MAG: hypothetical protein L0Z50_01705 [Verrucomicrobiales bacterium]|nr:hypothetical protein [Verrucomicrobiales bacterium]